MIQKIDSINESLARSPADGICSKSFEIDKSPTLSFHSLKMRSFVDEIYSNSFGAIDIDLFRYFILKGFMKGL